MCASSRQSSHFCLDSYESRELTTFSSLYWAVPLHSVPLYSANPL